EDDSWAIWTASYLNIPVVLVRDEEEAVDRPATAAEASAEDRPVTATEVAAEDLTVTATEDFATEDAIRSVEESAGYSTVPVTAVWSSAYSKVIRCRYCWILVAGILRAVPKRGPYTFVGRRVAARPADVASDATMAGSGVSQAAPPESAYAEPVPHRLQLFAPSGRRLTGRGLELRNRLIPMLYGGEEEAAETPQAYPMLGGPDSVDDYSDPMPPETPTIFGREYAVTATTYPQRLHNVAVEAAPLFMERGTLTEDLVERSERRRLQFQIASVYWFCGIQRGEVVDLLRNPESPLSLEEVLAY
ncbi:unnamed protein product, partial [Symbiodinium sp. CCMP2456]